MGSGTVSLDVRRSGVISFRRPMRISRISILTRFRRTAGRRGRDRREESSSRSDRRIVFRFRFGRRRSTIFLFWPPIAELLARERETGKARSDQRDLTVCVAFGAVEAFLLSGENVPWGFL